MGNREYKGKNSRICVNDYTVIDLETTSKYPDRCEVIEMAAVKVRNCEITETFSMLVRPQRGIPADAVKITGITEDMVKDAPDCSDVLRKFLDFVGDDIVVGHNINTFDVNIIYDLAITYFDNPFTNDMIDTFRFARYCNIAPKNYKLTTLTAYFEIAHDAAHRALADCIANQKCYEKMKPLLTNTCVAEHENSNRKTSSKKKSEITQSLQELAEFVRYVISDNILSDFEILLLEGFLERNQNLSGNYPYDVLYEKIKDILADRIITDSEREELMAILIEQSDPVQHRSEDGEICFTGKKVCLTGEFERGSRDEIMKQFEDAGAIIAKDVSSKVDYVIVGGMGSAAWSSGNYGSKVKKAIELQNAGKPIKIIREDVALKCLNTKELSTS